MKLISSLVAWCSCLVMASSGQPVVDGEAPKSADTRLEVVLFAKEPQIVHPVAIAFDKRGRLLVVESHTHFRPANYAGPAHDRIRALEDTDGDGRADRITTFFEGTDKTMDIAVHPDGSVYLATRNEILRLKDTKGTGVADQKERIVFLDTKGDYPHNGLSGLTFDSAGNLMFGLGENLGETYKLIGSDGTTLKGGGEGGNIYWCKSDGKNLRRYATGFWNPFGIHVDSLGRIIAVDNDPDSMPPCRMVHVVEGGDYGYQFRYGRSGRHPFQAWNGQLPGTLPMISGTGEAPCEVLRYESNGLPAEYFGQYFVTAWADHRLERYELNEKGASFTAEQKILIQGGRNFRPTGLTVALDGSLFMADWVLPDYSLHNKGAIWHVRPKQPLQFKRESLENLRTKDLKANEPWSKASSKAISALTNDTDLPKLMKLLVDADPFVQHAARMQLAKSPALMSIIKPGCINAAERVAVLLAEIANGDPLYQEYIPSYLRDEDEEVRFLAAKWIADQALSRFRPEIEAAMTNPKLSVRMMMAYATALARINGETVSDAGLVDRFADRLNEAGLDDALKLQLLRLVPPSNKKLTIKLLQKLLQSSNEPLRQVVVLTLCLHPQPERKVVLKSIAADEKNSSDLRALAQLGLLDQPATAKETVDSTTRPPVDQRTEWLTRFGANGNIEAGRRLFYHPQKVGCYRCHQVDGRGSEIGPDLSTIGRTEPQRILESLLQPSATVAPAYQAWTLALHDGRVLNGILVRTYLDEYTYLDAQGKPFTVKTHDIAETKASPTSIMPEGLLKQLTDQEVRDLLAFLFSRK
ncbi:MAG TPA: c-type cytochrome [Gemmatales bacterium]|nr:c-type cytochrome [Gemmatales bacterium]